MNAFLDKWQRITNVKRDLEVNRWSLGIGGHISVKICEDPLIFLITAGEVGKTNYHDEEFIAVNEYGEKVFNGSLEPSSEVLMHSLLYQETDAECVLHLHTVDNNIIGEIYGNMGEIVFKDCEMFREYERSKQETILRLPILNSKEALPDMCEEYSHKDKGAILVKNHGMTVWGKTIGEAKQLLETMEFLISYRVKLLMIQGQQNSVI